MKSALRVVWRVLRYPLAVIAFCALYFWGLQLYGNLHTVVPDEVYRAAQVTPDTIATYQSRYNIRSIINLRGENTGKPWYDNEVTAAKARHIELIDFRMSARKELDEARAKELIEVMRKAPKPVLIHCKSGADRTGLASALYLAAVEKEPVEEAEKELWPIYGHLPLPFIKEYAMDRTFDKMKPVLEAQEAVPAQK